MSIEQRVRDTLMHEAERLTPVPDVGALVRLGERARRRRLASLGSGTVAAVVTLLVAATWSGPDRPAEPAAPIDGATIPLLENVPVGDSPEEVVVDPAHGFAYVSVRSAAEVSVIDASTNAVVDAIAVGTQPRGLALDPDAGYVYVANESFGSMGSVSVIDTSTRSVVRTIALGVGTLPFDLAVDTASKSLFVAENGAGAVGVVDTRTWKVVDTIPVGDDPSYIAVDPGAAEVYVATGETLTVIDVRSREVVDTVDGLPDRTGSTHVGMVATDPAAGLVLWANSGSGTVGVLKAGTHEQVGTVGVGGSGPLGLQVDAGTATAYVTGAGQDGGMAVLDLDRLEVVGRVAPALNSVWAGQPAVDPDSGQVYAPLGGSQIGVIDGR